MYKNQLIDGVIKEPLGGAHQNPAAMGETLKAQIMKDIGLAKRFHRHMSALCLP